MNLRKVFNFFFLALFFHLQNYLVKKPDLLGSFQLKNSLTRFSWLPFLHFPDVKLARNWAWSLFFFLGESFQLHFANADVWLHMEFPWCLMIYDLSCLQADYPSAILCQLWKNILKHLQEGSSMQYDISWDIAKHDPF